MLKVFIFILIFCRVKTSRESAFYPEVGVLIEKIEDANLEIQTGSKETELNLEYNFPTAAEHVSHHTESCPSTDVANSVRQKIIESAKKIVFKKFYNQFGITPNIINFNDEFKECSGLRVITNFKWENFFKSNSLLKCALIPKEGFGHLNFYQGKKLCESLDAKFPEAEDVQLLVTKIKSLFQESMSQGKRIGLWVEDEKNMQPHGLAMAMNAEGSLVTEHRAQLMLTICVKKSLQETEEQPSEVTTARPKVGQKDDPNNQVRFENITHFEQTENGIGNQKAKLLKLPMYITCPRVTKVENVDYASLTFLYIKDPRPIRRAVFEIDLSGTRKDSFMKSNIQISLHVEIEENRAAVVKRVRCKYKKYFTRIETVILYVDCESDIDLVSRRQNLIILRQAKNSCEKMKFINVEVFGQENQLRKKRSIGLLNYLFHGAGLLNINLNNEIAKLERVENLRMVDLENRMFSKDSARLLISDVNRLLTTEKTDFCRTVELNGITNLKEHMTSEIDRVFQLVEGDVSLCDSNSLPASISFLTLKRLCVAVNGKHASCNDPNSLKSLFSCSIVNIVVDREGAKKMMLKLNINLKKLSKKPIIGYVLSTIPVPTHQDFVIPVKNREKPVKPTVKPSSPSLEDFFNLLKSNLKTRRSVSLNQKYHYKEIVNLPQILIKSRVSDDYTFSNKCRIENKIVSCNYENQINTGVNFDCAHAIVKNQTEVIIKKCKFQMSVKTECVSRKTYYNHFLVGTHKEVKIASDISGGLNFGSNRAICKKDMTCLVTRVGDQFFCNHILHKIDKKNFEEVLVTSSKINVSLDKLKEFDAGLESTKLALSDLFNKSKTVNNRLKDVENHNLIGPILRVHQTHMEKAKKGFILVGIVILSALATIGVFCAYGKYRQFKLIKLVKGGNKNGMGKFIVGKKVITEQPKKSVEEILRVKENSRNE